VPTVAPRYQGARETVRVSVSAGTLVGTAGAGVWLDDGAASRRLTPSGQICGNHVTALTEWKGTLWAASFDAGVCFKKGDAWVTVDTPFRMVNDLAVTKKGLVVAAGEGLFVSTNGKKWRRWKHVRDTGMNDLAVDGDVLWVTMPGALWRLPLSAKAGKAEITWTPGGARSLQAVAADKGQVWMVSEDHGALHPGDDGVEVHDRAAGLPSSWALDVSTGGGAVWVATLRHGLLRRGADGAWARIAGLEQAWLLFVGADADGRGAWVGAQGGLYRVDEDGARVHDFRQLPHENVHVVLERKSGLWVGTEGGLMHTSRDAVSP
jgi:ligand-binding sensor domain-containing protein